MPIDESRRVDFDRTKIDGREVLARQPATMSSPVTGGRPVTMKAVEEVLLNDGRTVYQCTACGYVGPSSNVVRGHLPVHGRARKTTQARSTTRRRGAANVSPDTIEALRAGMEALALQVKQLAGTTRKAEPAIHVPSEETVSDDSDGGTPRRAKLRAERLATVADPAFLFTLADQLEELYRQATPCLRLLARQLRDQSATGKTPEDLAQLRTDAEAYRRMMRAANGK